MRDAVSAAGRGRDSAVLAFGLWALQTRSWRRPGVSGLGRGGPSGGRPACPTRNIGTLQRRLIHHESAMWGSLHRGDGRTETAPMTYLRYSGHELFIKGLLRGRRTFADQVSYLNESATR